VSASEVWGHRRGVVELTIAIFTSGVHRVLHASNAGTVGIVGQHNHRAANTTIRPQVKCHYGHHWSREINTQLRRDKVYNRLREDSGC
jgi:hypothetical protein